MENKDLYKKLKAVNEEAEKVAKQVIEQSDNHELVRTYITEYGNRIYMLGLNDRKNDS